MPKQKQFLKSQRKPTKPKYTWALIWKKPERNGEQVPITRSFTAFEFLTAEQEMPRSPLAFSFAL
ncbi:MAG: hypothetical protein L6R42_009068 [Xanthoria sp. 1 TBL-2021]|nr:MAG: hypothetical protein L6R42_009068 [Xanthoria sp. 1 TBL-2021]